ncbi:MAG: putative rRNA maturation factor, partial [Candidatus Yanofskybacteria bacterium GW2011_GWA1_48_10]
DNQTSDSQSGDFFRIIIEKAVRALNLQGEKVEIGVHLVKPEEIQELNKRHLGKDRPTDVLSFPLEDNSLEKYGILPLGDIFICLDVAKTQAAKAGIPLESELARLTVHGFLHLLGYDHEKSKEAADKMFKLEEEILESI